MSDAERFACWTGAILIGLAGLLVFWKEDAAHRGRRRGGEQPVERLAEELKDAWSEYHTR